MLCRYETSLRAICPATGLPDFYEIIIDSGKMIAVEELQSIVEECGGRDFQEVITGRISERLRCTVTTVGFHSGIKTTCTVYDGGET